MWLPFHPSNLRFRSEEFKKTWKARELMGSEMNGVTYSAISGHEIKAWFEFFLLNIYVISKSLKG